MSKALCTCGVVGKGIGGAVIIVQTLLRRGFIVKTSLRAVVLTVNMSKALCTSSVVMKGISAIIVIVRTSLMGVIVLLHIGDVLKARGTCPALP